jgi:hypothetical protein
LPSGSRKKATRSRPATSSPRSRPTRRRWNTKPSMTAFGEDRGAGRHRRRAVNQLIAVMAQEGEDRKRPPRRPGRAPRQAEAGRSRKTRRAHGRNSARPPSKPAARHRSLQSFAAAAPKVARRPLVNGHGGRVFSSPLARRLAKEAGIDIGRIEGTGPAWPRHRPRRDAGQRGRRLKAHPPRRRRACPTIAPSMSDQQIRALYEDGSYDVVPARRHAPHHRAAADRVGADHSAFLSDDRLRHRQASRGARGDQRRGAQGQGRQARLQALGQRFRHQGFGARACSACRTPM